MPSLSGRLFSPGLRAGLPMCERFALGFYRWLINQNTTKEILRSAGASLRMTGGVSSVSSVVLINLRIQWLE